MFNPSNIGTKLDPSITELMGSILQVRRNNLILFFNVHGSVRRNNILTYIQQDATLHSLFYLETALDMFRVVPPPIIRSANNSIYSIWYLSHRYCYLPLSWKSWNWFECAVGGVRQSNFQVK